MKQTCAAFVATAAAGALLFLAASCGGGGDRAPDVSQSQSTTQPQQPQASNQPQQPQGGDQPQQSPACNQQQPTNVAARYVAIDLHTSGYLDTLGFGVSDDGEQVGGRSTGNLDRAFTHAVLWRGSASSIVDLHPNGFTESEALATGGGKQVGWGFAAGGGQHALMWSGSASSVVDLDPSGFRSEASGIAGDQVVGFRQGPNGLQAVIWSSRGVVNLHPSGFQTSVATATDGTQQVGGGDPIGGRNHALLWTGSASSVVDLHPVGYSFSGANGVSGGQQVGYGDYHALLWASSAQCFVDLHPSGFYRTVALATAAGRQAGWGITMEAARAHGEAETHALLWNGTADSVIDLHLFLPPGFFSSQARGIDASGNVIGTATAQTCSSGCAHAILWVRQ